MVRGQGGGDSGGFQAKGHAKAPRLQWAEAKAESGPEVGGAGLGAGLRRWAGPAGSGPALVGSEFS